MPESEALHASSPARIPVLAFGGPGHRRLPDRTAGREAVRGPGRRGLGHRAPTEYDPTTGDDTGEMVEVGPGRRGGVVGLGGPPAAQAPAPTPFAWALIRLDGADTAMLHVVDSGGPDALNSGDRVTVRFRPAAERIGAMADIEAFVPEGGAADER